MRPRPDATEAEIEAEARKNEVEAEAEAEWFGLEAQGKYKLQLNSAYLILACVMNFAQ